MVSKSLNFHFSRFALNKRLFCPALLLSAWLTRGSRLLSLVEHIATSTIVSDPPKHQLGPASAASLWPRALFENLISQDSARIWLARKYMMRFDWLSSFGRATGGWARKNEILLFGWICFFCLCQKRNCVAHCWTIFLSGRSRQDYQVWDFVRFLTEFFPDNEAHRGYPTLY